MANSQKSYPPEFKQQLVDCYRTGNDSYPQLEREYGISKSCIWGWVKNLSLIKISTEETIIRKEYKVL